MSVSADAQLPVTPSKAEIEASFGDNDRVNFVSPSKIYYPETWFHFIGGNVSKAGITADLEAIAEAGISGVQLFHGQFGGAWPGVEPQIACLSPSWDEHVRFAAEECRRLGLRFTMQNCPGWAMSGGPWITPSNAMRDLVWSRTDVSGGQSNVSLPTPQPSREEWRDYQDITVLAFPVPEDDSGEALKPLKVNGNYPDFEWSKLLNGTLEKPLRLPPAEYTIDIEFDKPVTVRTVVFSSVERFNHGRCYEPDVHVALQAVGANNVDVMRTDMPQSNWQDNKLITLACDEVYDGARAAKSGSVGMKHYRLIINNKHDMTLSLLKLFSASRKNNFEAEAGWTLRSHLRAGANPKQSPATFIKSSQIIDITQYMDRATGRLTWKAPKGKWTVLRVGHVNAGHKNGPAPAEGTGWECDKLSVKGPDAHFAGYIGRLTDGALGGGLLNGMLLDSWECNTQTWTSNMESEFQSRTGYALRKRLPALFGYVVDNHDITARFLLDWRGVIGDLFANGFYGRMATLAKSKGLDIQYETAAGDIFPADILEYYKHADVPMTEFWQPVTEDYVGSINFKPIRPTASAARMYGKPRVAAEAFTSFALTFDEHLSMLKEVANVNCIQGVTHLIFHTYTHNPRTDWLPPGTAFGDGIGTPFLRGQTWWRHAPEFTTYLARLNYMLERGKPVSDVLWYLGDEISHKPDQKIVLKGYKYDYCNQDVLLNRLTVRDGRIVTPEGISYRVLWMPDNERMLPETLEKLVEMVKSGAVIVGSQPVGLASLKGGKDAQRRFDAAVRELWGKGTVLYGISIEKALQQLDIQPDVITDKALWLHRQTDGADWYYITAPYGEGLDEEIKINNNGKVEIWDPLTGNVTAAEARLTDDGYTAVKLRLARSGSCFAVFRKGVTQDAAPFYSDAELVDSITEWTLSFPSGWGAPSSLNIKELKAWKDLDILPEGKAFSGTVTYRAKFNVKEQSNPARNDRKLILDLGDVEMIAVITLNGKKLRTLWTPPYSLDITDALQDGDNELMIEVTSTWFNRLVYDAGLPENERKTWTIKGPNKDNPLRNSGLLGPVTISIIRNET
jgi:hypothetical protein